MRARTAIGLAFSILLFLTSCNPRSLDSQAEKAKREIERKVEEAQQQAEEAKALDDLGSVGSAARPLLRPDPFTKIVLEIAFVAGREPTDSAVSHSRDVLKEVTGKAVSVQTHEIPPGDDSYSAGEIRDLSRSREAESSPPTGSIWIAYLNGSFSDDDQALGVAAAATVAAIFPDQIATLSSLLVAGGIEKAVILHEVGHLLGLVNIGYESKIDHEDPDHPNHSRNKGSVMFWAVETLSVRDIFRGGPPDDFDADDRTDLKALASG